MLNSFSHRDSDVASEYQCFLMEKDGAYGDDIRHKPEVIHAPDQQDIESDPTEHERTIRTKTAKLAHMAIELTEER